MPHVDWHAMVAQYGYAALALGTFVEGEGVLLLGGLLAQRGILLLPGVIGAAFCGAFASDQLYFWLGRQQGSRLARRYPGWQARLAQVHRWLTRSRNLVIFAFRFIYGVRTVAPLVLGASQVGYLHYLVVNGLSGLVWASVVATVGFYFGAALLHA